MTENEQIREYAETYAKCLVYYGVDVREKLETATQISLSLENAYMKGRHDEYKRLDQHIEELKAYRAVGTVEEFKALKDKNEPKEVAYQIDTSGYKHEKCPACGSFHVFGKHCTECGQSIIEWWQ